METAEKGVDKTAVRKTLLDSSYERANSSASSVDTTTSTSWTGSESGSASTTSFATQVESKGTPDAFAAEQKQSISKTEDAKNKHNPTDDSSGVGSNAQINCKTNRDQASLGPVADTIMSSEEKETAATEDKQVVESPSAAAESFPQEEVGQQELQVEQKDRYSPEDVDDVSIEEDTLSSEAIVDDIELILMPETVQDIPSEELSPQLVRVTELKSLDFDDNDEMGSEASEFRKLVSDDYEDDGGSGYFKGPSSPGGDVDEDSVSLSSSSHPQMRRTSIGEKVHSGVQTEISALESGLMRESTSSYEFNKRSWGKSSGRPVGVPSAKRLNWKSELTLLPSKTKIRVPGFSGYESINYEDQYSPRVTKFTSQETLNSSSSQLLKPSTLYRTRNLSRNLNQCVSSESTLELQGIQSSDSTIRFRDQMVSSTSSNFKDASGIPSDSGSGLVARRPIFTSGLSRYMRTSLPDLTRNSQIHGDNKVRQQSFMKHQQTSTNVCKLPKRSSSDDETSSLIDESERCLRASIDLLLTDDLPLTGRELSATSVGIAGSYGGNFSYSYQQSRRFHSQPCLNDERNYRDPRETSMGSPFLPRKLSDMRCSKWAKVILPNGQVSVVCIQEIDELRDLMTVSTDSGCILTLPFRKVVFAWKRSK